VALDRLLALLGAPRGPLSALAPAANLLSPLAPPLCWGCGAHARSGPLCGACRAQLQWLGPAPVELRGIETWAPVAYDGPARELVKALKFRGAQALADTMAAQIAVCAPPPIRAAAAGSRDPAAGNGGHSFALVPVPLHPRRERRRGFNQARLLADALAARLDVPAWDGLDRRGPGSPQVGRSRSERLELGAGSGAIRAIRAAPLRVVLVDDVATTGATLAACARALRAAGAAHITAVTYARTPAR